jgi:hypothetical protein
VLRGCSRLKVSSFAALGLCLIAVSPLEARKAADGADHKERTSRRERASGQTAVPDSVVLSGIGRGRASRNLQQMARTQLPDEALAMQDLRIGTPGQSRMVGRLPLHERVDLGVGLFAVSGAPVKERELKRTDPMRDVAPRTSRLAGAGLRVNF